MFFKEKTLMDRPSSAEPTRSMLCSTSVDMSYNFLRPK